MKQILSPLVQPGRDGMKLVRGDGIMFRGHPLFAAFIGDYPEQILVTCTTTGDCVECEEDRNHLGDLTQPVKYRRMKEILELLDSFDERDSKTFYAKCKAGRIKPVVEPFWKDFPYVHIYRSITPDVLHQLYQGVMKHMISWIIEAYGAAEIDARCRRLPPNHNIHLFMKGISSLSRVSGKEHSQMCKFVLGLVVGIPLDDQQQGEQLVRAVRALLDFLYLARFPVHTEETLKTLEDALTRFHDNKDIFIILGIRDNFNIPKLHFTRHYIRLIKLFGTTDNFDTEYTERLHIDLAKDAYDATNHKDEYPQMTLWLERKEKVHRHQKYMIWCENGRPAPPRRIDWLPPGLDLIRVLSMAKHPTVRKVFISDIVEEYGARNPSPHSRVTLSSPTIRISHHNNLKIRFKTLILPLVLYQSGIASSFCTRIPSPRSRVQLIQSTSNPASLILVSGWCLVDLTRFSSISMMGSQRQPESKVHHNRDHNSVTSIDR
jgi:hypothetical protein